MATYGTVNKFSKIETIHINGVERINKFGKVCEFWIYRGIYTRLCIYVKKIIARLGESKYLCELYNPSMGKNVCLAVLNVPPGITQKDFRKKIVKIKRNAENQSIVIYSGKKLMSYFIKSGIGVYCIGDKLRQEQLSLSRLHVDNLDLDEL